jgi:spore coat polysaccharide biosynthesis predicted glycosyltransferase SpsG
LRIIEETCVSFGIKITVVLGMGYQEKDSLSNFTNVLFFQNVGNMVDYIREADLVFTSAGRTTYEIASQGIPAIVLAQNERELTHLFACQENGFIEMGLGFKQTDESILKVFLELVENQDFRVSLIERMRRLDLIQGKKRVMKIINNLLNKKNENY